ncbi:hypothetical protein KUTeg_024706 [Tegillarca granosa]|uniref:Autophagy-related protein 101 n=1 Tax=Tegillarca granosa TaxID=220873 RepID=A0ABQ9DZ48_TEGGR|nr:hypothetical protein KUTeg_024706 [Tegillarca granosa]
MNARSQIFELSVEGRQIEEVFHYTQEGSYSIGTVGIVDVDCDFVDFTYVRVGSDALDLTLKKEVSIFRDTLRSVDGPGSGQISLEFFQKKRARWPFPAECIPWEVWTVKLDILTLANENERQICREKLGEILSEKVIHIAGAMNKHEYVPKMPNQAELDLIFDTTIPDVQPYLFRMSHQTTGPSPSSVGTTMRKFIKDTLAL